MKIVEHILHDEWLTQRILSHGSTKNINQMDSFDNSTRSILSFLHELECNESTNDDEFNWIHKKIRLSFYRLKISSTKLRFNFNAGINLFHFL